METIKLGDSWHLRFVKRYRESELREQVFNGELNTCSYISLFFSSVFFATVAITLVILVLFGLLYLLICGLYVFYGIYAYTLVGFNSLPEWEKSMLTVGVFLDALLCILGFWRIVENYFHKHHEKKEHRKNIEPTLSEMTKSKWKDKVCYKIELI